MELIFNEWFVEYMVPGSGHEPLVHKLLDAVERRGDLLVVRQGSPFVQKLYRYSKQYQTQRRPSFRRFLRLMVNSAVVRQVSEDEITRLPPEVENAAPRKDLYLVELAVVTADRTIVTTDEPLKEAIDGEGGIRVLLLDEFLNSYGLGAAEVT